MRAVAVLAGIAAACLLQTVLVVLDEEGVFPSQVGDLSLLLSALVGFVFVVRAFPKHKTLAALLYFPPVVVTLFYLSIGIIVGVYNGP